MGKNKSLPELSVEQPKTTQKEAKQVCEQAFGWMYKTKIDKYAGYDSYKLLPEVINDALRARAHQEAPWYHLITHTDKYLHAKWDSFRVPIYNVCKATSKAYMQGSETSTWEGLRQGLKTHHSASVKWYWKESEVTGFLWNQLIGSGPVTDGTKWKDKTTTNKAAGIAHQILNSKLPTIGTSALKQVLDKGAQAGKVTPYIPFGIITAALAAPFHGYQEHRADKYMKNAFDAYYSLINALTVQDLGLMSFCYYDPLFMHMVYPDIPMQKGALATVKAAMLQSSNNVFNAKQQLSDKDGQWLAGLVGAGTGFGIGVATTAIVAATALTGPGAILAGVAGALVAGLAAWATSKVTKEIYQYVGNKFKNAKLSEGTLTSAFSMHSDYANHFFYQCPICFTLYLTPLNEDPNKGDLFHHSTAEGSGACMVCNAFYTMLMAYQKEAAKKGVKTKWAYNELLMLFKKQKKLRRVTYYEMTARGIPTILGATAGTAGGFDPALFLDTLFRYKLCCLFPDSPGYDLSPKSVRMGNYYRRGQLFQAYSPFAIHFMGGDPGSFDVYEMMKRIIQYITFPLPTELAVHLEFYHGAYMAKKRAEYSREVRRYWSKELFMAGTEIAGLRSPPKARSEEREIQLELKNAIGPLGGKAVTLLSYDKWKKISKAKGLRKKITKVDKVLKKYLDYTGSIEGKELLREIFTSSTAPERVRDVLKEYKRRLDILEEMHQAVITWIEGKGSKEKNPRFPAVQRLNAGIRREKARLLSVQSVIVEPLAVRLGMMDKAPMRGKDERWKRPPTPRVVPMVRKTTPSKPLGGSTISGKPMSKTAISDTLRQGIERLDPKRGNKKLDYKQWMKDSAVKVAKRKGIVAIDKALRAYLDYVAFMGGVTKLKSHVFSESGDEMRLQALKRVVARRMHLLEGITQAIEHWEETHIPAHTNKRYPAVDALRYAVEEEVARMVHLTESLLEPLGEHLKKTPPQHFSLSTPSPRKRQQINPYLKAPIEDPQVAGAQWCPVCSKRRVPDNAVCMQCGYIF